MQHEHDDWDLKRFLKIFNCAKMELPSFLRLPKRTSTSLMGSLKCSSHMTLVILVSLGLFLEKTVIVKCERTSSDFIHSFTSSSPLQQITNTRQAVYISGTNVLLKLSPELALEAQLSTGPVDDNLVCRPAPSQCQIPRKPVDNLGSVLEIGDSLLVCGTARLGLCQIFSLTDLNVSHTLDSSHQLNYVGSRNRTFAFYGKGPESGPNLKVLYAGITYDKRPVNLASKMFSSLVVKHKLQSYSIEYLQSELDVGRFSAVDLDSNNLRQNYIIQTVYGFQLRNYTYFLTVQPETLESNKFHTRLARICTNSRYFINFMQIPLVCEKHGVMYNIATAAWVHKVESDLSAIDLDSRILESMLYVTFGRSHVGSSYADPLLGSALCVYRMKHVRANFISQLRQCYNGLGYYLQWVEEKRNCVKVRSVQIKDDDSFCYDHNGKNIVIEGSMAITQEANYTTGAHLFTSVAVTTRMDKTVAVMGREDGMLLKFLSHQLDNGPYAVFNLSQRSGVKVEQDVTFDITGKHLYLMTGNTVHRFPMDSCRVHQTCEQCIQSDDPLICGWCDGICTVKEDPSCTSLWFNDRCLPLIHSFSPIVGPTQGGTRIVIKGENFGSNHQDASVSVKIGPLECEISRRNMSQIECQTSMADSVEHHPVSVSVKDDTRSEVSYSIHGQAHAKEIYKYVAPVLSKFSPLFGPLSGGTNLTITGKYLNVGSLVQVTAAHIICKVLKQTSEMILCVTAKSDPDGNLPLGKVLVELDSERLFSEQDFSYREDPVIENISPRRSFLSGGVNIKVSGRNLDVIQEPRLGITIAGIRSKKTLEACTSNELGTEILCHSPNISLIDSAAVRVDPSEPLQAHLWFRMDGVEESLNLDTLNRPLSQFSYYPDPYFEKFDDPENLRFFDLSEESLDLEGYNLVLGFTQGDITVRIGSGFCNVSSITNKLVKCNPLNKPESVKDNEPKQEVQVKVGYLVYDIGHLKFTSIGGINTLGVVLATILILCVVAIVLVVVIAKRKHIGPFRKRTDVNVNYIAGEEVTGIESYGTRQRMYNLRNDYHRSGNRGVEVVPNDDEAGPSSLFSLGEDNEILPLLRSQKMLIDRDCLDLKDVIGQGHFGCVYESIMLDAETNTKTKVAVKTLHKDSPREIDVQSFLNEALIMKDFNHPNILTLIGICLGKDEMPLVVLPYMTHGDMLTFIRDESNNPTVKELIMFGVDIAQGMQYLGELKFVHRDLAARNCMLDDSMRVKVADFGLSRDIYEKDYYSSDNKKNKLPVKWMAIESLEKGTYNAKTDVWSFGVVLWELMTRGVNPYPEVDNWDVIRYLRDRRRMPQPTYCPDALYTIMLQCWVSDPDIRPKFQDLTIQIKEMLDILEQNMQQGQVKTNINNTYINVNNVDYHYTPKVESDV